MDSEIYFILGFSERIVTELDPKEILSSNMKQLFTGKHILIVEDNELNLA